MNNITNRGGTGKIFTETDRNIEGDDDTEGNPFA